MFIIIVLLLLILVFILVLFFKMTLIQALVEIIYISFYGQFFLFVYFLLCFSVFCYYGFIFIECVNQDNMFEVCNKETGQINKLVLFEDKYFKIMHKANIKDLL